MLKLKSYLLQHNRAWIIGLLLATLLVYLPFVASPFIFDDLNFFNDLHLGRYLSGEFHFGVRWFSYSTIAWTYYLVGNELTHLYHIGNILVHAANVIAIFYLLKSLATHASENGRGQRMVLTGALLGALVYAVHPLAVYAAGYVIQRSILMATLFSVLMQLSYIEGLVTGRTRWFALTVAAYFLAVFSKEHSVMLPALLLLETYWLRDRNKADKMQLGVTWAGLVIVALIITMYAKGVIGVPYEADAQNMFELQNLTLSRHELYLLSVFTQMGLFFKYILLMILPNPAWMSIDMRETMLTSWGGQAWLRIGAFFAYGLLGFGLLLRSRSRSLPGLLGIALLVPWVLFLPELSSIRVQEIFVLYRSYLWLLGISMLPMITLIAFPGKKTMAVLVLVVLCMVPLALNRLWVMGDNYQLWSDAAKLLKTGDEPLASRIYYNLANAEATSGRWALAVKDYERSVGHWKEPNAILEHDLGVAYFNVGRYQDALFRFDQALALNPDYAKAYFDSSMALMKLKRNREASLQLRKSCELKYPLACLYIKLQPSK